MSTLSVVALHYRGLAEFTAGDLAAAGRDFAAVVARKPGHADAIHHLGLIARLSGRRRRALRLLRESTEAAPRRAVYFLNLGGLLHELGRTRDALDAWETAARLDGTLEDAFINVGLTSAEAGDHGRAARAFSRVTAVNPDSADAFRRLAASLRRLGRAGDAGMAAARARELAADPQALVRFAAARWRAQRPEECLRALARAIRLAPGDPELHFQLGNALVNVRRDRQALKAYARALALDPNHESARYRAAAIRGESPTLPPAGFVARHFDTFSTNYDEHMLQVLRYRGPSMLWRAVRRVLDSRDSPRRGLNVLDAGCGTGLSSTRLRSVAKRLVGVDLSPGMVERAKQRGAYDELVVGELITYLMSARHRFDLVFSADVFNYIGDLALPMRAAAGALRPGGLLAFTLEAGNGKPYALTRRGRFVHSAEFAREAAEKCRLVVRHVGTGTPRYEGGMPVRATVVVLQKPQT
jgi:predicted TPR repeat methyltransferase/Tfp pilus assembly protein PilF